MANTTPQAHRETAGQGPELGGWAINCAIPQKMYVYYLKIILHIADQPTSPENKHILLVFGILTFSGCHNHPYNPARRHHHHPQNEHSCLFRGSDCLSPPAITTSQPQLLHCPRSGPGQVRAYFADPEPEPRGPVH